MQKRVMKQCIMKYDYEYYDPYWGSYYYYTDIEMSHNFGFKIGLKF